MIVFYLKKSNLFRNSDVLDGDQKYKKVVNSDSGIWHLSSVGDEFYLPGEAALHTTTEIWTLRLFLGGRASFSH